MFRGLFNIIGFLLATAVLTFLLTGAWIVYDGIHDRDQKADAALVPGYAEIKDGNLAPALTARLDRAAALYAEGKFPSIVVSGVTPPNEDDETDAMAHYLEAHNVPAAAIIQDHRGEKASDTVDNIVRIAKEQHFHSVMLINTYYRLTRMKLVLHRLGLRGIGQAHAGQWQKEDIQAVLNENVLIYQVLNQWYLFPTEKKISDMFEGIRESIGGGGRGFVDSINHFLNPELKK